MCVWACVCSVWCRQRLITCYSYHSPASSYTVATLFIHFTSFRNLCTLHLLSLSFSSLPSLPSHYYILHFQGTTAEGIRSSEKRTSPERKEKETRTESETGTRGRQVERYATHTPGVVFVMVFITFAW